MGNFLNSPIINKDTEDGVANKMNYGVSSMQGWRASMEDSHTIVKQIPGFEGSSLFAVFDGHGGSLAAEFSSKELLQTFRNSDQFSDQITPEIIGDILRKSFFEIDRKMKELPEMVKGEDHSGCTAIAAIITPTHIIVANSGDSRSCLAFDGHTVPMSFDHKPFNDIERERIEKAGGHVRNKRVNGDLAVSRALGDFMYKQRHDLSAQEQQVSAEPDIKIHVRTGKEEFLLIACDGIWDVMSNEVACDYVRQLLNSGEHHMGLIAEEILDRCLDLGSRDNMSAIVLSLPGIKYGKGTGVKKFREEREKIRKQIESNKVGLSETNT